MDIFWGVVVLLLVVGPTVAALAVRREDPARPWFPAGSDGAWPGAGAWGDRTVHGERWDRDAQRLDADLRAAASRPESRPASVDAHEVAAELVLRRVVPNPAVRDGVRGVLPASVTPAEPSSAGTSTSARAARRVPLPR
ncbi:hypothetical protein [Cellulosimicrobium protaetiae]|uniref:Uncharacterized protein n=1 Tax=Cellulosimicrobium protaetiae TaxID=2587808 RepID=A0A6M5UGU0_9MICO|nr:hypothetical protein [Cellulosimicrobium protaetiae]QJW36383.1 hypothetical protein FIC82_009465 [Cellulosimicrobium protaetiae]